MKRPFGMAIRILPALLLSFPAVLVVAGCGGGAAEQPAAASPASEAPMAAPADTDTEKKAARPPTGDERGEAPATSGPGDADRRRAAARRDLDRAEREVATGDCESACRALASMERAATHLCELTSGGAAGEADDCHDAEARVKAARARVRAACGTCPGGPTLEPER